MTNIMFKKRFGNKVILSLVLFIAIVLTIPAYAQLGSQSFGKSNFSNGTITKAEIEAAATTFSNPGILPDNPFYFFKRAKENIQLFFTFSAEDRAKLHLELAKTRLAEAKSLIEQNKLATVPINDFNNEVREFNLSFNGIGRNVSAIARESQDIFKKSTIVLNFVLSKTPEQASTGIKRAINVTSSINNVGKENEEQSGGHVNVNPTVTNDITVNTQVHSEVPEIKIG